MALVGDGMLVGIGYEKYQSRSNYLTWIATDLSLLRRIFLRLEGGSFPHTLMARKRGLRNNNHLRFCYLAYRYSYHGQPTGLLHHLLPRHYIGHQSTYYRYVHADIQNSLYRGLTCHHVLQG